LIFLSKYPCYKSLKRFLHPYHNGDPDPRTPKNALPDPDLESPESGSNADPDPKPWQRNVFLDSCLPVEILESLSELSVEASCQHRPTCTHGFLLHKEAFRSFRTIFSSVPDPQNENQDFRIRILL